MKIALGNALGVALQVFFVTYIANYFLGLTYWPGFFFAFGLAFTGFVATLWICWYYDQRSRKRVAELEATTNEFLATASHELRRPLAALRTELDLAVRHPRSAADLRHAIELALQDAEAMSRLTDDLLFHARDRAGALTPDADLLDLTDLVYGAVDRSQRALPGMPTLYVGDLPDLEVRGDEAGLSRTLENLIVNAGKHAGADARVTIDADLDAEGLAIRITDDGPGIPADEQAVIFDAFARGDRARAVGGSGLGLAIARSWARAHQGDLTVTSPVPGGDTSGARFTVHLPQARLVDSAHHGPDDGQESDLGSRT